MFKWEMWSSSATFLYPGMNVVVADVFLWDEMNEWLVNSLSLPYFGKCSPKVLTPTFFFF